MTNSVRSCLTHPFGDSLRPFNEPARRRGGREPSFTYLFPLPHPDEGVLLLASNPGAMFGLWERRAGPSAIPFIPIALWEFSLRVYLVAKGFKPSSITADGPTT